MSAKNNQRQFPRFAHSRQSMLAAAVGLTLAHSVLAQSTTLYFDTNGTTAGYVSGTANATVGSVGTGTWDEGTTPDWNTASGSTTTNAPGFWNQSTTDYNMAVFQANHGYKVTVSGAVNVGALNFQSSSATTLSLASANSGSINIGANTVPYVGAVIPTDGTFQIFQTGNSAQGKAIIAVPIVGSTNIEAWSDTNNGSSTIDFAGDMSQFTGNMYLKDFPGFGTGTSGGGQFQIDSPMNSAGTIYLDQNVLLTSNNQVGTVAAPSPGTIGDYSTGTLVQATPNIFTLSNPLVLNYNNVANTAGNTLGAPNGPTITIGGVATKFQKIITYSGAISSPAANSNLIIGGTNGTTILSGNNTYTGNTYAAYSNSNGLLQLGSSTALPSTTVFVFGNNMSSATTSVGPMDLGGNNINIAGLQTGSSGTAALAVGNIYNLSINNPSYPVMANGQPSGTSGIGYQTNPSGTGSTITITPVNAQSTVFNGDIGDSNVGYGTGVTVAPFTNNAPYSTGTAGGAEYVTALTNVSLVLNGPTSGSGNGMLTLAPVDTYASGAVTGLPSGNEYAGTTTINSNATLVFGRGFDKTAPAAYSGTVGTASLTANYTLSGNGDVTVNSGGTLASLASPAGFFIGGAQGNIILKSGASFLPGEGLISGTQGAKGTTTTLSPNNVGSLSTNNILFNAGASMTFSIANGSSYDYIYLANNLNLDDPNNSNHQINIDVTSTGTITPGTYNLVNANEIDGTPSSYTLNTSTLPASYASDKFSLAINGFYLQLDVQAPLLQWDPSGNGPQSQPGSETTVTEMGGEWTDGNGSDGRPATKFYNQLTNSETTWSNTSTFEVLIGNDALQNGGVITLGNNIVAASGIEFGSIAQGHNYSIQNSNGNNYSLTIGSGGIQVANTAATGSTWSAEIDVPVVLSASQSWSVPAGQSLLVTGSVTGAGDTLTFGGGGLLELSGTNGTMASVVVSAGTLLVASTTAIGNASVSLNNSAMQWTVTGTYGNAITIGSGRGGATAGTATYTGTINTTSGFEAIGSGNTIFQGTVGAGNLQLGTISPGGAAFSSAVTVAGTLLASGGTNAFNGSVTVGTPTVNGALSVTGGTTAFNGMVTINGTSTFTGGTASFNNSATANVFSGGITIQGGTVNAQSANALGTATITFPGAGTGGLNIDGMATLANPIISNGSGATTLTGNSYGCTVYFDSTIPLLITGSTGGTGDQRWYATGAGTTPQITFNESSTRTGGAQYFNGNGSPMTIVVDNTTALGTSTEAFMEPASSPGNYTIDVETGTPAVTGVLRGEILPGNTSQGFTLTKTGPGTLSTGLGPAGSSYPGTLNINQSAVDGTSSSGIGGQASTIMNINIAANAVLGLDYNGTHTGGAITMAAGSTIRRDLTVYTESAGTITGASFVGETDFAAASAADVVTIAGNATIDDANIEGSGEPLNTSGTVTLNNPVVVNSGVVLTLENDDPQYDPNNAAFSGYNNNSVLAFRGPTALVTTTSPAATSNAYDDITLKPGATIKQTGPGEVRFGRFNSQGIAIVAQGTPGTDALLQAGSDWYMVDNNATANQMNTLLVVNGSGNAGLRIEAAMSATYEDPNSPNANLAASLGTTGLLGDNSTITNTGPSITGYAVIGNAFTIMSPNRLLGLSAPYNNGTSTITPSGTLTLAANDAGNATGLINGGPAAAPGAVVSSVTQGSVALALDNTSTSGGTHIYQIDPGANGATFANFAGLTVERTYSGGAAVTAQLLGTTKVPSLSITGGAKVDITNQALAVDPATGSAPTATIRGYLVSAYDNGNWDGAGIGSTSTTAVGTTIGYVENDLLTTPYTNFGGQTVDNNAVLVKYTYMGDLNLDGVVDSTDLAMMGDAQIGWFGGDINYDNTVNADDWSLFMLGAAAYSAHGQITSAVPEPAAVSMLAVGAGMMLRRRRRA